MKKRWKIVFILAALCLSLCGGCAALAAGTLSGVQMETEIGYGGTVFLERWYPLYVTIKAGESPVDGEIAVRMNMDYMHADEYRMPVSVPAGETERFHIPLSAMTMQRTLDVRLIAGGVALSDTATALRVVEPDALVIGVLGGNSGLIRDLNAQEHRNVRGEREIVCAVALDEGRMAKDKRELCAFDVLVLSEQHQRTLDEAQRDMIDWYEESGGVVLRFPTGEVMPQSEASAVTQEMEAAQIMAQLAQRKLHDRYARRNMYSVRYGTGLHEQMTAAAFGNLWPLAVMLSAYVLLTGVGLYGFAKRTDRSKTLWLAIPALSAAVSLAVLLGGKMIGQNQPMTSSVHIVHIDEEDRLHTEERVLLTMGSQESVHVNTQNNLPITRYHSGYWYGGGEQEMNPLRDVIRLGEAPSVCLMGEPAWLVRSLVVENDAAPQGDITTCAWVDEAGLHLRVQNGTDTPIYNAVFLSGLGYASLGDLAAGGETDVLLARQEDMRMDEHGNVLIGEKEMLRYVQSSYNVLRAYVDPERATNPDFKRSSLSAQERTSRNLLQEMYSVISGNCMLAGEVPDVACEPIWVDGEAVARNVQCSLLFKEINLDTVSPDGYYYYPSGTFEPHGAFADESGELRLGEVFEYGYAELNEDLLIGYHLAGVDPETIREMHIEHKAYHKTDDAYELEAYDHVAKTWISLESGAQYSTIKSETAARMVSAQGELFMRYRSVNGAVNDTVNPPSIVVEGRLVAQEGSEAQ